MVICTDCNQENDLAKDGLYCPRCTPVVTHMGYGQFVEAIWRNGQWHTVRTFWDHDRAREVLAEEHKKCKPGAYCGHKV